NAARMDAPGVVRPGRAGAAGRGDARLRRATNRNRSALRAPALGRRCSARSETLRPAPPSRCPAVMAESRARSALASRLARTARALAAPPRVRLVERSTLSPPGRGALLGVRPRVAAATSP